MAVEHDDDDGESQSVPSVANKKKKKTAKKDPADARTEFRGVRRQGGRYRAQIWDPKGQTMTSLGCFGAAEDAARAYDAAAIKLHGAAAAAAAKINFKGPAAAAAAPLADEDIDAHGHEIVPKKKKKEEEDAAVMNSKSVQRRREKAATEAPLADEDTDAHVHEIGLKKKKKKKIKAPVAVMSSKSGVQGGGEAAARARPISRSGFRGVYQSFSGSRYNARIWDPVQRAGRWLGTFEAAEEAAEAYDAAAVSLYGARAITNFEQPTPTAAAANDGAESSPPMELLNDFPALTAPDFSESLIPGPQVDNLLTYLPPAEWQQQVHELLHDMDFTDDVVA